MFSPRTITNSNINNIPLTTKGDLLTVNNNSQIVRLPVGSDTTLLRANSGATDGIEWASISTSGLVTDAANEGTGAGRTGIYDTKSGTQLLFYSLYPDTGIGLFLDSPNKIIKISNAGITALSNASGVIMSLIANASTGVLYELQAGTGTSLTQVSKNIAINANW